MFEHLKKDISVGDTIKLSLTTGKEPEGEVAELGDNYVLLKTSDGTSVRCFDRIIGGWEVQKKSSLLKENAPQPEIEKILAKPSTEYIDTPRVDLPGLKVVGKIDLDVLRSKKKKNESGSSFVIKDKPETFNSFVELKKAIEENKLQRFIPANAEINRYFTDTKRGSANNPEVSQILFRQDVVLDESVLEELARFKKGDTIPVIVSYYNSDDKTFAEFVTKPTTVENLIQLAKYLASNNKKNLASCIISYLVSSDIVTAEIEQLRKSLPRKNQIIKASASKRDTTKGVIQTEIIKNGDYSSLLNQARKYRHAKDFLKSEELFQKVIAANFSTDSAVKDLADQYREQGDLNKAIELVKKHFEKFTKREPAFNFLYDLYVKNKNYENAIEISKQSLALIPKGDGKINRNKRVLILTRLTVLLVRLNKNEEAEEYLKEAADLDSENVSIKSLIEIVGKGKTTTTNEEIEALFDENQFLTLVFGLSPFLQEALNKCEYDGIPPKDLEKRNFSRSTIFDLRRLINQTKTGQPELRAKFYLTEAKLLQEIEPENVDAFYSSLSKYCNAMAIFVASKMGPMDVTREYYLNSFMIRNEWDSITNHVSLYIQSIYTSSSQIVSSIGTYITVTDALKKFNEFQNIKRGVWDILLELIIASKSASAKVLSVVYQDYKLRSAAISYLDSTFDLKDSSAKDPFIISWNRAAQKRKFEKEELLNNYLSLSKYEEVYDVVINFITNKDRFNKIFLSELDKSRAESIGDVCDLIHQYLLNTKFDDKEFYYNSAESKIGDIYKEIERFPTTFSLTALKPTINHLTGLLRNNFSKLIVFSKPILSLNIEGESSIAEDKLCEVQISIASKPESSKVGEVIVEIEKFESGVQPVQVLHGFNQTLRGGGESLIAKFKIQVDDKILEQGATSIGVKLSYKELATGERIERKEDLSVPFYDSSFFHEILNPYAEHAKSNVVENPKMFKGRDELIERISDTILSAKSKGYVIYGQKRSGKSSVLWHLDNKIKNSGKAFSVFFSLGKGIGQDDNVEVNLHYYILSNIEKVIRQMKVSGELVPEIGKTNYKELISSPNIVFYERLNEIRNGFDALESWRGRKIVLIIDEFTYLFYHIRKGTIPTTFMQKWKALVEDGSFSVILAGQDSMAKFMAEYQNEFAIFKGERLTYIDEKSARELVDEPIWDHEKERSRYTGNSIEKILELTASSPFYIQIFCSELVRYMNLYKKRVVTPADIADLTVSLTSGVHGLGENDFENLMVSGDKDLDDVSQEEAKAILRKIALQTKNILYCRREDIGVFGIERDDYIIKDLIRRTVISEQEQHPGRYKIQVQLFKYWLLNHY